MSAQTNIDKAIELKQQGNEFFKAGNFKKAMVSYHEIFMYVHGFSEGSTKSMMPGQTTTPVTPEQMAAIRELKVAHFSNLSMCHLKLGNVERARDNCTKALAIDPTNEKALFRRGKCYSQLGALDEAKADLEQVLARSPDNRDALREMQTLKRILRRTRRRNRSVSRVSSISSSRPTSPSLPRRPSSKRLPGMPPPRLLWASLHRRPPPLHR